MPRVRLFLTVAIFATAVPLFPGCGPSESPIQAVQRPLDFDILAPVQAAGSDGSARHFREEILPNMIQLGAERFNQKAIAERFSELALDPERLRITERTRVRVYFVGENAGLQNTLGISLDPPGAARSRPQLIFPNATTPINLIECANRLKLTGGLIDDTVFGNPSAKEPVVPGDFVDLGMVDAGTTLNFFLVTDGGRSGTHLFWPDPEANADKVQHMVAIAMPESPYMIVSFEDLPGGGDRDYSDCVFAVSLSNYNVEALLGRIDPWRRVKQLAKTAALLLVFLGGPIAAMRHRRRVRRKKAEQTLKQAEAFINQGNPAEALALIRQEKNNTRDVASMQQWQSLELSACEGLHDVEAVSILYEKSPATFVNHENSSLWVARAAMEYGQNETVAEVTTAWRNRNNASGAWRCLDADVLIGQDKNNEALKLLESTRLEGDAEAARTARIALLQATDSPGEARNGMEQALQAAPGSPEVHLHAGRLLERLDDAPTATRHMNHALKLVPGDPFLRDEVAAFQQRNGDNTRALRTWAAGLAPPSTTFLWLKTLFWRRVAVPVPIDVPTESLPEGPLRPLIDLILKLPEESFWDEHAFDAIIQHLPELAQRQEVFWLRLLGNLHAGEYEKALSLLNLSRFGRRAWHPQLETSLLQILTFRKYSFLDSQSGTAQNATQEQQHPFFDTLTRWSQGTTPDDAFLRLMQSEDAPAAACLAAGWHEAGLRLQRATISPGQFPTWYLHDIYTALQQNRPADQANGFARAHGLGI